MGRRCMNNSDHSPQLTINRDYEREGSTESVSSVFARLLKVKRSFTNSLLSLPLEDGTLPELSLGLSNSLTDSLCSLISLISNLLTLMMKTNPTNSIDYNNRPYGGSDVPEGSLTGSSNNGTSTEERDDIYKKLLGLGQGNNHDFTKGTISPFVIPMLQQAFSIVELVKNMPASLIGVVVGTSGDNNNNSLKQPQDLVVSLSNSMNDIIQITSLINMLKPFKVFERDLRRRESLNETLVAKLKQNIELQVETPQDVILRNFIHVGWRLLDDDELGWL